MILTIIIVVVDNPHACTCVLYALFLHYSKFPWILYRPNHNHHCIIVKQCLDHSNNAHTPDNNGLNAQTMDSEPPPVPNAFLSWPITQFLKDRTTETQPTSFPASFQTSHTSSSVFAATSPTSISAAATSPTFLSVLSDLQDEEFVDYLLSSTASENLREPTYCSSGKESKKIRSPKVK